MHVVSVDELVAGEDVAFRSFCEVCSWSGGWWHADSQADFPAVSAYWDAEECAREEGADHVADVPGGLSGMAVPAVDALGYAVRSR